MCLNDDCNLGPIESGSSKSAAGRKAKNLGTVGIHAHKQRTTPMNTSISPYTDWKSAASFNNSHGAIGRN